VVQAAAAAADVGCGGGGGSVRASWAAYALAAACPERWRLGLMPCGGGGGGGDLWNLRAAAVSHQIYRALAPAAAGGDVRRVLRSLAALLRAAAAAEGTAAATREEVGAAAAEVAAEAVQTLRGLVRGMRPARLLLVPQVRRAAAPGRPRPDCREPSWVYSGQLG
jgi:hypothetical protein